MTGTKTAKVRDNLLKEKKLTLEKAIDIACAGDSTAVQMKVMSAESGLSAVKEKEKEQSENVPSVSSGWINSVVGTMKDGDALPLVRLVHIVKRIILLPSAQQKARRLLSKSDSI